MELRIAPELFLKELIVGGFERIFEIGKVFRNEGISPTHNPEFTICEFYAAYNDYNFLMPLVEQFFRDLVRAVAGSEKLLLPGSGAEADFSKPFARFDIIEEMERHFGRKIYDGDMEKTVNEIYAEHTKGKRFEGEAVLTNAKQKLDALIGDLIETRCASPSFIMHHPTFMSPLAKACARRPKLTERFELFVGQREVANGYSELDDYAIQKERFVEQQKMRKAGSTDPELHGEDAHFIEVLKYGMPPTAGCGIGIDRLCMMLTGATHIREVISFPHFRSSVAS